MTTAAFIVRLHYPEGEQANWRMAYFEAMVLPRIRAQRGFTGVVCVWCDDWQRQRIEAMGCVPFGVRDEFKGWIKPGYEHKAGRYHVDFVPWRAVVGMPRFDLQIAIDSDELLLRDDTLERIRAEVQGETTAHVSFQHELYDVERLELCTSRHRYSATVGSAFYALWQPRVSDEDYVFAYDDSHLKIGQQMQRRLFVPESGKDAYVAASVHKHNASTHRRDDSRVIVRGAL